MAADVVTLFVSPTVRLRAELYQWTDKATGRVLLQATFTTGPEHAKHLASLGQMLVGRLQEDRDPYQPRRHMPTLNGLQVDALRGLVCWPTRLACVHRCELPEPAELTQAVGEVCRG